MTKQARIKIDIKKNALKERLDIQNVAAFLSDGWRRYTGLFGEPPHGTVRQMLAMLELSYMDLWQVVKRPVPKKN